jgi:inward rectifier potassium channel
MSKKINITDDKPDNDLGLGSQLISPYKMIDKNGNFRVKRKGEFYIHPYQWLLEMSWFRFHLVIFGFYTFVNLIFASIYYLIGVEGLSGEHYPDFFNEFAKCFFFSVQTLTTVGYGAVAPICLISNIAAATEALIGLLIFALVTGLYYAKFTRPNAKILFSNSINISPYKDGLNAAMFRIANQRSTELIEVEVQMTFSWVEENETGVQLRRFFPLDLERSKIMLFPLNWTVVHPITENSPFWQKTQEELTAINMEILCFIKANDVTFGHQVKASQSYQMKDLLWARKFIPMYYPDADEGSILHLNKINDTVEATLY